eukprot:sb/3471961/
MMFFAMILTYQLVYQAHAKIFYPSIGAVLHSSGNIWIAEDTTTVTIGVEITVEVPALNIPDEISGLIDGRRGFSGIGNLYYKLEMNVVEVAVRDRLLLHKILYGYKAVKLMLTLLELPVGVFKCFRINFNSSVHIVTTAVAIATVLFERGEKNHPAQRGWLSKGPYLRRTQWVR